jgi:hypothetical protein
VTLQVALLLICLYDFCFVYSFVFVFLFYLVVLFLFVFVFVLFCCFHFYFKESNIPARKGAVSVLALQIKKERKERKEERKEEKTKNKKQKTKNKKQKTKNKKQKTKKCKNLGDKLSGSLLLCGILLDVYSRPYLLLYSITFKLINYQNNNQINYIKLKE